MSFAYGVIEGFYDQKRAGIVRSVMIMWIFVQGKALVFYLCA